MTYKLTARWPIEFVCFDHQLMSAVVGAALRWHYVRQLTSILNQIKQYCVATYRLKIEPKTLMSNLTNKELDKDWPPMTKPRRPSLPFEFCEPWSLLG